MESYPQPYGVGSHFSRLFSSHFFSLSSTGLMAHCLYQKKVIDRTVAKEKKDSSKRPDLFLQSNSEGKYIIELKISSPISPFLFCYSPIEPASK